MTAGLALGVAGVNALVGLFGVWRWYRVLDARRFWPALRVAQAAAGAYAVYGGVLVARGDGPDAGL